MPPKVRITKEMVAKASFEIIRRSGHESLSARAIAEYLGCSTQPVLYNFRTVEEIREAAYETADKFHTDYILPKETDENPLMTNPLMTLGLNYVRFGHEEKNLFRFLFQTDKFGGKDIGALMADPDLSGVLEVMAAGLEVDKEQAGEMFLTFFCVAHGLASLLANNSMEYEEGQCRKMLEEVFFGMIAARKGS